MPTAVVRFNNTESLKKAQMYVRHTNRIFSKQFARLIASLFQEIGEQASTAHDSKGDCVFNKPRNTRFHFIPLEQIAGFPKVPWIVKSSDNQPTNEKSIHDKYVIMVEKDAQGINLLKQIESYSPKYEFCCLVEFMANTFGEEITNALFSTFKDIENRASTFEWYELARTCNKTTIEDFMNETLHILKTYDYQLILSQLGSSIDNKSLHIILSNYISGERYKYLVGDNEFSKSFYTSEWLYKSNSKDNMLDKTYLVTGYIKSVEQLLSYIVKSQSSKYKIAVLDHGGLKEVPANSNESLHATLGNMVYFLKSFENRSIFFDGVSSKAIKTISSIIQEWIKNERNGYFHKHNINNLDKVDNIRNSTLLIYFLLLGSIKSIG